MFSNIRPQRVAGAIEIYDDAFTACDEIMKLIHGKGDKVWVRAQVGEGHESDIRTNNASFIDFASMKNPASIYLFGQKLFNYLDEYGKRYQVGFAQMEPACINRYEVGQEYKAHADDGPVHPRIISALIYMNDVEEGGETYFPLFDVTVNPKKGRLVIFPSNYAYIHEARPPKSGVKYSMAVWATPVR